ncbi:MAG TPA: FHA domain-containing protein [Anaerolineales bacterium]|nr:FHA domain-containing protein [Anaerolineales bacterium]
MSVPLAPQGLQLLLLATLYLFLGTLLFFLWRDERRAAQGAAPPPAAHLALLSDNEPALFSLAYSNLLGRAPDNAIRIEDPLVSAHHARISFAGGQWLVEDLGSRNGTRVNELPVDTPIALASGDIVHLGGKALRFSSGPLPADDGRAGREGR